MAKDAKGHGSDKRGAHSAGVNKVGNLPLSTKVLPIIRKQPWGFSVKPNGQQPTGGFMVSLPGHTQIVKSSDLAGPNAASIITNYARQHADALRDPKAHIGGWTDDKTGLTHLDVSHNIKGRTTAIAAGKARNQIAIWDVKHVAEIRTGGKGDKH